MSDIALSPGQMWVPTKTRSQAREITWTAWPYIEWRNSKRDDIRCGQVEDFRAWITRTGAVLREADNG